MPSLAELQHRMGSALLAHEPVAQRLPTAWFENALPIDVALRVHRNTLLGGCVAALRLSYPAIAQLLGEAAFDALVVEYARQHPPTVSVLAWYGDSFGEFVAGARQTAGLPRLLELAAFEWQFDRLSRDSARDPFSGSGWLLAPGVTLRLARTLRLHRASFAVDELRARLLAPAAAADSGTSITPIAIAADAATAEHCLALWRTAAGVNVQSLSPCAARFIETLQRGQTIDTALQAAQSDAAPQSVTISLEREVLRAGFAWLTLESHQGD
jgi:hypothetical protein